MGERRKCSRRRADLIPNLVETAKMAGIQAGSIRPDSRCPFASIECNRRGTDDARGDKTPEQKQAVIDANNSFGGTIGRLLSLQENYPVLRSNEAFMKVQDELSGTENRINTARLDFNDAVTSYNTTRNSFPAVLTAGLLGFKEEPFFQADPAAKTAPSVGDANSMRKTQPAAPVAPPVPAAPVAPVNAAPTKP
ncbi:MAG: LemA family protein [Chloracidobacterium sp.]|nr:LemA family protein [Chloracidobacterium sp.]